jgi:hypothetical protein
LIKKHQDNLFKKKIIRRQHIGSPTFQIVDMGYELELV